MKLKTIFLFFIFVSCFWGSVKANPPGQDSLNILFIGNSFTYENDEPLLFENLAQEAGIPVHVESYIHLGEGVDYFMANDTCWLAIKSRKWDYVVIQDLQSYYYDSLGVFPQNIVADNLKFQDSIKKLIPCVKLIYMAGWEQQGGIPSRFPGDNTYLLINRILSNYKWLNDQPNVHNTLAPVGVAWKRSDHQRPDLILVSSDSRHPSVCGSYLYASVMFCTVFRQDPTGLKYSYSLPDSTTHFLRNIAYQAFMDTISYTNIDTITVPYIRTKNKIVAGAGYSDYQWYKNDTLIPGHTYDTLTINDSTAIYSVSCTNAQGCRISSFASNWSLIPTSGIDPGEEIKSSFKVFPNPVNGNLTLDFGPAVSGYSQIRLYGMDGKLVRTWSSDIFQDHRIMVDLPPTLKGMYMVDVNINGRIASQKVIVQ